MEITQLFFTLNTLLKFHFTLQKYLSIGLVYLNRLLNNLINIYFNLKIEDILQIHIIKWHCSFFIDCAFVPLHFVVSCRIIWVLVNRLSLSLLVLWVEVSYDLETKQQHVRGDGARNCLQSLLTSSNWNGLIIFI